MEGRPQSERSIPPMRNILNYNAGHLGSLDPFAFRAQFPGVPRRSFSYTEIAQLSMRADSLKQENEIMKLELLDLITTDAENPFYRIKKSIIEFGGLVTKREKEINEVRKYLTPDPKTTSPTFVEVNVHRARHASFDLVATSLLVSNEQRHFFAGPDLRRQNEELAALIEHQEHGLKLIRSRLDLYRNCQRGNSIRIKLDALKKGENPPVLSHVAPGQVEEQRMKIQVLREELKALVQQRQQLTEGRVKLPFARKKPADPRSGGKSPPAFPVREPVPRPPVAAAPAVEEKVVPESPPPQAQEDTEKGAGAVEEVPVAAKEEPVPAAAPKIDEEEEEEEEDHVRTPQQEPGSDQDAEPVVPEQEAETDGPDEEPADGTPDQVVDDIVFDQEEASADADDGTEEEDAIMTLDRGS
jgi:hypothetical protein